MGFSVGGEIDEIRIRDRIMDEAKKAFKPEFLNRLTEIVMFHSLSRDSMSVIVELELDKLKKRLKEQRISLSVTDESKEFLIEKGYDEKLGARPLRRAVEKYLEDTLAESLLAGAIKKGKTTKVLVSEDGETLVFKQTKADRKVSSSDKSGS
jgi:ATP-dependent Clp protease ATP-binding subunit ClpC